MRFAVMAMIMLLPAAACAAGAPDAADASPSQIAAVKAACTRIIRLEKGQAQWAGCVEDLSQTVAHQNQDGLVISDIRNCQSAGLQRGTPEFSNCMLAHQDDASPQRTAFLDASRIKASDDDSRSYFSAPFGLRRHREGYACAAIGMEPGSAGFQDCVNNLASELFYIGTPNG